MSNVYTIHPKKSDLILFYEVVEPDNGNTWGGASCIEAIEWLSLAPAGSRLLISAWDSDEEDAHLVGQSIDVTDLIKAITEQNAQKIEAEHSKCWGFSDCSHEEDILIVRGKK